MADNPTLRWYQDGAVDSLFEYFAKHQGFGPDGLPVKANPLVALPTGTGKSLVIGEFVKRCFTLYPSTRVMMATHVKELIEQNERKMLELWPHAPVGIYSAGLNKRNTAHPIVFGGVQSMAGKYPIFGRRDLLVIDEAHLLAEEGRYQMLIHELMYGKHAKFGETITPAIFAAAAANHNCNPYLKVIGLTATPYRSGLGLMTNGNIFTHVCYDMTDIEGFARLIAEGFLCSLIPKRTEVQLDVTGVAVSKGDYNLTQLEAAVDKSEVTYKALNEFTHYGQDRRSWCIFASGIQHAEHIGAMLKDVFGVSNVVIHSKKSDTENAASLKAWKRGDVQCAVNMNSLTTGIDHPELDYIGMLRPTTSTGLWVQMLGRGTRPAPGKENCLVMDFAGNTKRLGPINDPVIPRMKGSGPPGDAPVRICDECGTYNHARATECIVCGSPFEQNTKLSGRASTDELMRGADPVVEEHIVSQCVYSKHTSRATGRRSVQVSYFCGYKTFYEWVTVEGSGFPAKKGRDWFRQRYGEPPEDLTNDGLLQYSSQFRAPAKIKVWVNKKYPAILSVEF